MNRFFERIQRFMYGRYGIDALGRASMVLYIIIAVVNIFIFDSRVKAVIFALQTALFVLIIFRMLSRNIYARQKENNAYLRIFGRISPKIKLLGRRIKDIRFKRYRTCPNCKSVARLPIRRGHHTVRCPGCHTEFKVYIMF